MQSPDHSMTYLHPGTSIVSMPSNCTRLQTGEFDSIRFDSIRTRGPAHLITLNYTLLFMENYKSNCTRLHWGGTPGKIGDHLTLNYT